MLVEIPGDRGVENPAEIGLPASASRVLFYEAGFSDSSVWIAYTGTQKEMEAYVKTQCGRALSELDDWKPSLSNPVPLPARSSKLNQGKWDVDEVKRGKTFSSFDGHSGIDILVDTVRWRIFLNKYTT